MTTTFIYLIHNADDKAYKIGKSDNPTTRLKQLQTGNARSILKLLYTFSAEDSVEYKIHEDLEDFRLNGEWFTECEAVLRVFLEYLIKSNQLDKEPFSHNYCYYKNKLGTPTPSILTDLPYKDYFNNNWIRVDYKKDVYIITTCNRPILYMVMKSILREGWKHMHQVDVPQSVIDNITI